MKLVKNMTVQLIKTEVIMTILLLSSEIVSKYHQIRFQDGTREVSLMWTSVLPKIRQSVKTCGRLSFSALKEFCQEKASAV